MTHLWRLPFSHPSLIPDRYRLDAAALHIGEEPAISFFHHSSYLPMPSEQRSFAVVFALPIGDVEAVRDQCRVPAISWTLKPSSQCYPFAADTGRVPSRRKGGDDLGTSRSASNVTAHRRLSALSDAHWCLEIQATRSLTPMARCARSLGAASKPRSMETSDQGKGDCKEREDGVASECARPSNGRGEWRRRRRRSVVMCGSPASRE